MGLCMDPSDHYTGDGVCHDDSHTYMCGCKKRTKLLSLQYAAHLFASLPSAWGLSIPSHIPLRATENQPITHNAYIQYCIHGSVYGRSFCIGHTLQIACSAFVDGWMVMAKVSTQHYYIACSRQEIHAIHTRSSTLALAALASATTPSPSLASPPSMPSPWMRSQTLLPLPQPCSWPCLPTLGPWTPGLSAAQTVPGQAPGCRQWAGLHLDRCLLDQKPGTS